MAEKKATRGTSDPPGPTGDGQLTTEATSDAAATAPRQDTGGNHFPIVGIGASAGGLSALKQFFAHVPADSGLAFVVVVHLAPEHESHLVEILQPHVKMPVRQVTHAMDLERNRVYVIPPNANLDTIDTQVRLTELEPQRQARAPIDHFFSKLSETHDGSAIGVILSGTGSDGTLGLQQIRARGGLTVVQDPREAEYDGMPRSAITASRVDLVLRLADIPGAILRFAHTRPSLEVPGDGEQPDEQTQRFLQKTLTVVRARTGRDFSHHKRSTILRRISRRMQFNRLKSTAAYLDLLREQPEEASELSDDLLITVTSFFRDPEVFAALEKNVIPQLFAGKGPDDSIRVWSVGCATGEEAYSLAMLLIEEAEKHQAPPLLQVFASDLHPKSLARAREGYYPTDIEPGVSPERLSRFFEREDSGYRVRKEVREMVIFAPHNVLADPPFSRLDLILCRNLLIYLDRPLHSLVAELFHYALRADGFLVLGTSETLENGDLFRVADKKCATYRRRNVPAPEPRLPVFPSTWSRLSSGIGAGVALKEPPAYGMLHQHMVEQHGPPSVLISPDNNVVHSSAHAGRYLLHPGGAPTSSVFKLVRDELRIELRAALSTARVERRIVRTRPIATRCDGELVPVVLDVRPALAPEHDGFLLVMFEERAPTHQAGTEPTETEPTETEPTETEPTDGHRLSRIHALEAEKNLAEQRLQYLIQEHETSQEDLKASNEELQSANEELRSTLEELETSKEELQSMNEELQTVNQENRHKVEELDLLSSDLQNLLVATDIATLFLDRDMRILRFTPEIGQLFNIRMTDTGRALSDFTTRLGYGGLEDDARKVLAQLIPVEREVQDEAGRWYLARVLPYRDRQDRIAGVVVTFVDITRLKQAEEDVRRAKETSERIIESLPEPLLVLTPDLRVHSANTAFYQHFEVAAEETLGRPIYALGNQQWDIPGLRDLLDKILVDGKEFSSYQVDHVFKGLGRRVMLVSGRCLEALDLILLGIHDITTRHQGEQALRESEERFRALVTASSEVLYRMSPDWREMRQLHSRGFLAGTETPSSTWIEDYVPPADRARVSAAIQRAIESKSLFELEHQVRRIDGNVGWALSRAVPILDEKGELVEWFGAASDATERREAVERLKESDRRKDEYLAMLGHELRNPLGAIRSATELILGHGQPADERSRRAHEVLHRQALHMSKIIDGLLDVSRIARGKIDLNLESLDLRTIVSDVLGARSSRISSLGLDIELEQDLGPEPLWVLGDPVRLAQVFENLLGNAVKFTPPPGRITVTVQRDGEIAVARVRDTGVGIGQEFLPTIFEPFRQGTQDVGRVSGGLGLGLSLAKGLVDLHHGTIEAHSAGPAKGAEFVVRLPLGAPPRAAREGEGEDGVGSHRILIVEDNADAAQMLRDLLEISGHTVLLAESGRRALDVLRDRCADLVLCDIGLPGMSGYELARAIRSDPALCDIPLVALTGYGQQDDRARTAAAGFDDHLVKPIDLETVNATLRRFEPQGSASPARG